MTITVTEACTLENFRLTDAITLAWGFMKDGTQDYDTTVYFQFSNGVQDQLYSYNYNDPVPLKLELTINQFGSLELTKTNLNRDLIDGAVFNISGTNYNQNVTVVNGKITVEKLKRGTYTVKEVTAPVGYLLNTDTYTVTINPNQTTTQTVVDNEPTGSVTLIKRDKETGAKPQGDAIFTDAEYKLYADEDIYNKAGTVKHYSKGDLVATRTMDEAGKTADITGIPLGKYIVKETRASLGYLIDTTVYNIELKYKDQNTAIILNSTTSNEEVKKMQVHLFKSGIKQQSGAVQGLEGAEFTFKLEREVNLALAQGYTYAEIWNGIDEEGDQVSVNASRVAQAQVIAPTYDKVVTDQNGDAYTIDLPYGKYLVKETKTPLDFETAEDFTFSITQDSSEITDIAKKVKHIVINNEQLETYIKLVKKDLKTNNTVTLTNATFQIQATKDIYDRGNGKILYKKDEIITQKIGSTTYNSFTTNADDVIVPDKSYNSKNDEKGSVVTPLLLPVGSYKITEIKIPTGFIQLDTPVLFEVNNIRDYDVDNDGDYIKEVVIKNEQPTGTLIIDKSVALRTDVDKSLVDVSDLSGIKFRLTAKEDIKDFADGSIIYKKDTTVGEYGLDKNGDLKVENLPMGTYELTEIGTLDGLVLNEEKFEIKFTQQDTVTKVYIETREIENKTTVFEFSKTDITGEDELIGAELEVRDENDNIIDSWTSTDKSHKIEGLVVGKKYTLIEKIAPKGYVIATSIEFVVENTDEMQKVEMVDKQVQVSKTDITGENEIEGAELEIRDKDDNIVDYWTSGEESHYISGLQEGETYTLIETLAPDGYVISSSIEFTVTLDKDIQKIKMLDKQVLVSKICLTGKQEIEGAKLEIRDKDDNVVDSWTSSKKPHYVSGLKEGETYTLIEIEAPYMYLLSDSIEFTVILDKNTQKITMEDEPVVLDINIAKSGFIETQSKDTIYYNFKNIENRSNVALDNFTWRDVLPTEALRADRIYTGTWNQDLQYSIWYKTNLNDYKMLVEDLNTNTNYEIKFSDAKLQEDEYITEYEFRFETVDIGFREVESPILYCKMLDGLKNGFVFTNYTKVFGTYLREYVEDNDNWKTVIYNKTIQIDKLPRTRQLILKK